MYNFHTICRNVSIFRTRKEKDMDYKFEQNGLIYLEQLLPLCSDAVTMINEKGIVLYWNEGAEAIYQISKEKIIGKRISDFFQEKDLMVLKLLNHPQLVKGVYHNPRPDSHVVINASPIFDREGELIGAISVEQNITKLVKLNEELDQTALELNQLTNKKKTSGPAHPFSTIRGSSKKLHEIIKLATKVATTDASILITGESGVGKELFSRAIHSTSNRKERPFIPINCGAIPDALFESELFGYEAGAFTGASKHGKKGKLELADKGTLFLDEIGELPLEMQVKLLRVLQEQEFYRVGGTERKRVDVRIIAATNQNLEQQMTKDLFREDLFYRLNVFSIHIPPLRERPEDIVELIQMFLIEFSSKYHKSIESLPQEVLSSFLQNDWPGNVRQLRNMIERYVVLYDGASTEVSSFKNTKTKHNRSPQLDSLKLEKETIEKEWISEALKSNHGNKSAAARKLGISRATLYHKMKRYDLSDFYY
jgi:PAS domain S-box-containing protein